MRFEQRARGGTRAMLMLLAVASVTGGPLAAQGADRSESTGSEGALFLLLPVGARAVSLGRVVTALESAEAGFWNPAGLAGVDESQVVLFRGDHVAGTATAFSGVWANPESGTLGASYSLLDAGEIDQRDENGNFTGTITIRNHLAVLSGATRLVEKLNAGLSFKLVQFRLSCRGICPDAGTAATTWAVDAGIQTRVAERLRLGAMVAHVGPRLQVENAEQADPLPARARIAAAYDIVGAVTDHEALSGWIGVELQDRLRDPGSLSVYFGSEVKAGQADAISLRAGHVVSELGQEEGTRVGLGLRFERFDLSIAKSLAVSNLTGETEPVHVTFSIAL
ncbi:MAG: PorV/PorQ family protein [Gemmatimonadota bacterium]|nr:PorV/PorQ family protein [Gemmatimonadota bacterium]